VRRDGIYLVQNNDLAEHDLIVIGASARGVEGIPKLAHSLPDGLAAAVLIAVPAAPHVPHLLTAILNKVSALPAHQAVHGHPIEKGQIYVAPPDQHLQVCRGRIHLDHGPRENGHRPAVDRLFRSAADFFGPRVVAVLLNGTRHDGTAGLHAVKSKGGIVIVQDPAETLIPGVAENSGKFTDVDFCLPLLQIGNLLSRLTQPVMEFA